MIYHFKEIYGRTNNVLHFLFSSGYKYFITYSQVKKHHDELDFYYRARLSHLKNKINQKTTSSQAISREEHEDMDEYNKIERRLLRLNESFNLIRR